jgi:hypothetical protein
MAMTASAHALAAAAGVSPNPSTSMLGARLVPRAVVNLRMVARDDPAPPIIIAAMREQDGDELAAGAGVLSHVVNGGLDLLDVRRGHQRNVPRLAGTAIRRGVPVCVTALT